MPNNIDFFSSYYMAGVVQEIVPPATFFRDRYFPTDPVKDIFAANKVLVEYRDGDRMLAPFVVARKGDVLIDRKGYEVHEYEAPMVAPSRLLTLDDLKKRGFGEALYAGSTQAERAAALQLRDLTELEERITRREEWLAAQTMINNGFTAVEMIDDKEKVESFSVVYYDVDKGNPAQYAVNVEWDNGGDFWKDVQTMCEDLADRGLPATDLVVGTEVAHFILEDEKAVKRLDNRRMEFGNIAPKNLTAGVTWLGRLNFGGFELDIYVVRETYVDDEGSIQRYFPTKSAMVTAPNSGRMMYAQITQIEPDNEFHTFALRRVPKFVVDRDKDTRKLRLATRPLAAPNHKAPWMYAPNVLK